MAEQAGLEPAHRVNDERISNPLHYLLCSLLRIWWDRLDLNQQCLKEPDLQSGAVPITLYYPIWRKMEDSNPQDPITDVHVGFLDRCLTG